MADSDLAIGAAGSTSWERCCLGLPTLLIVLAENQRDAARFLENKNGRAKTGFSYKKPRSTPEEGHLPAIACRFHDEHI